jgi:hypothetical protein
MESTHADIIRDALLCGLFGPPKVEKAPELTTENILSLFDPEDSSNERFNGVIESREGDDLYEGPRVTVQILATYFDVSESTILRRVHRLKDRGLLGVTEVRDPAERGTRLWVHRAV